MPGLVPGIHALHFGGPKDVDGRVKPGHDEGNEGFDGMLGSKPAHDERGSLYPPMRTSSSSDDDTCGTCSPSEARETEMRVLLNAVAAPDCESRLFRSSVTSTLYWPLPSSAT